MFLIDGHCDTITTAFKKGQDLFTHDGHINLQKLHQFEYVLQFFAIWIEKQWLSTPFQYTNHMIDFFTKEAKTQKVAMIHSFGDVLSSIKNQQVGALLALEGGEALEGNLQNVDYFYQRGVRSITLTWNGANLLGDGIGVEKAKGLTPFGKAVVNRMNTLGMIVDVSHLSEKGFWDVYQMSSKPFIASHSNSRALCGHKRNLTDEQIKAIAKKDGLIGINLYPLFLSDNHQANRYHILKHIEHMLHIAGENHVGLGADFDGIDQLPAGVQDVMDYESLYKQLQSTYGKRIADKIVGGNFIRLLEQVL